MNNKKGFTLTEVLVVIIVVAILAAISIPLYGKVMRRSRVGDAMRVLGIAAARQEVVFVDTGKYATNFSELGAPVRGLSGTSAEISNFTYTMSDNCIVATRAFDSYALYKNFVTDEVYCVGVGCELFIVGDKEAGNGMGGMKIVDAASCSSEE